MSYGNYIKWKVAVNGRPKDINDFKFGFHIHHILPKYMLGDNSRSNLVYLTAFEHVVAHRLRYYEFGCKRDLWAIKHLNWRIAEIERNKRRKLKEMNKTTTTP